MRYHFDETVTGFSSLDVWHCRKLCYTEITYFKEELLVYGNRGWS